VAAIPRLPIWLYLGIGILVLAIGWVIKVSIDLSEQNKAEALLLPAPEAVLLEEFNPKTDVGAGEEVTIRAQLAAELTAKLSTLDGEIPVFGTFFGLFPVTALDSKRSISAILLSENIILEQSFIDKITVGNGPFGPIVEINGRIGSPSNVQVPIARSLEGFGRVLPDDIVTIVPFVDGREVALRPDLDKGSQVFSIFGLIGGIYIAYGLLRWYLRRKRARI